MVLSNPPQFCRSIQLTKCDNYIDRIWDKKSLTIHGFWPSSSSENYDPKSDGQECTQDINLKFNQSLLSNSLKQ